MSKCGGLSRAERARSCRGPWSRGEPTDAETRRFSAADVTQPPFLAFGTPRGHHRFSRRLVTIRGFPYLRDGQHHTPGSAATPAVIAVSAQIDRDANDGLTRAG